MDREKPRPEQGKPRSLDEATNSDLINILNDIYKAFPSLNFKTKIPVVLPDGSGERMVEAEAIYDKELFERLMPELAKRLEQLAKYQEYDKRRY